MRSARSSAVQAHSLPATIHPMLARLSRHPFDSPDHIFELKWDGIRALAFIDRGQVRLQSRNLQDITSQFPELSRLPEAVKADGAVLDGELVCFDRDGHPSLIRLQQRLQRQAQGRSVSTPPVHFVAFDLLYLRGVSLMKEPLVHRKNMLHEILNPTEVAQPCEFIETDGTAFFQATCDHGLEGIMAKGKSSPYNPGKRTVSWLKVKRVRECEFVIGGYAFGGKRRELLGSLLLGLYDENQRLEYVGQVGTGFSQTEARRVHSILQDLHMPECPFTRPPTLQRFVFWCRPEVVCRVEYGEFSTGGKLRYPVYQTLRDDKPATDCRIFDAPGWPRVLDAEPF